MDVKGRRRKIRTKKKLLDIIKNDIKLVMYA